MLIKRDVLEAIKRGEITIGRMDEMSPEAVTEAEARKAGFRDIPEFRKWLGTMKEGPLFHRIEVGYLGETE